MQYFYRGSEAPVFLVHPDAGILRDLRLLGELVYWREFDGSMVAPPWLVYAELLVTNDPRAMEAAEEFRREFLQ